MGKYGLISLDTSANILNTYSSVDHFNKSPTEITSNIGQFYFGARSYDPGLGIWFTKDPAEVFFNSYAYTGNGSNPVNFVDPYGQELVSITIGLFALAITLYWAGHSLENYEAGMPPSNAFNPFKKYDGKLVWFSGTEEDLNQLSNSGAGVNIDGENSGFYYDVAGQRNYAGGNGNNSAEANADAIRNAYSKINVPAPKVDLALIAWQTVELSNGRYAISNGLKFNKLPTQTGDILDVLIARLQKYSYMFGNTGSCYGAVNFMQCNQLGGDDIGPQMRQRIDDYLDGIEHPRDPVGGGVNIVWWPQNSLEFTKNGSTIVSALRNTHIGIYCKGVVLDYSADRGWRRTTLEVANDEATNYPNLLMFPYFYPVDIE